ncbi:pyocin knob domain-containing protein [Enterobacter sp. PTB]|uniref:pyocin knob domain-containing protein n=1 Tax=Enterobacter sp. PTB TaxID=3143437 RepID=UPI003DA84D96
MSAGFISLKNNSTAVTGSGTDFKTDLAEGDFIIATVGGVTYTLPVKTITDATNLIMAREYNGPAQGNIAWTAMPRDTLNSISAQIAADTAYAIRSRILEINNWYQLLETNGDVTIKMADGSTYTGPSWLKICDLANASDLSKIQPLADQIHRDATQVAGDKTAADNSAKAASASASGAASSATAAKGSADTAGTSATAAAKSAGDAAGSATAAKGSADTAGSSATAAAKSAGDAAGSATAAKGSADTAGSSATAAAKSAGDAAGSATAAKNSADTAGGSATAAAKSASDAAGSATAAKHSADTAGSSATAAAGSASSAGTSETHAASSATSASQSADRAEAAARNASAGTVKTVNGKAPDDEGRITLGSAADADIVTSMTDTTAGRVPVVGWMGIGVGNSGSGCPVSGGIDYVSEPTGIWQTTNENTTGTFPPNTSHYGTLFRMRGNANDVSQLYFPGASVANGGNIYFRQYNGVSLKWGNWYKIYSEFSKPTAAETGALPNPGTLLTSIYDIAGSGIYAALGKGNEKPTEGMPDDSGNTRYTVLATEVYTGQYWVTLISKNEFYVGQVVISGKTANWCRYYNTGWKPTANDVGALPLAGGTMAPAGQISVSQVGKGMWTSQNTVGAPVFQNIDTTATSEYWPIFKQHYQQGNSTWSAGMLINEGDFHLHFLNSAGDTANFRWVKDGQFIPGNYTNFDARYGQKNTASKSANSMYTKDETTGVMEVVMSNINVPNNTSINVTFPVAFPTVCVGVVITYNGAGMGKDSDSAIFVPSYSRTGCVLHASNANGNFTLIAKGY